LLSPRNYLFFTQAKMQFTTFTLAALSMGSAFAAPSAVARQPPSVLQNAIQAVAEAQTAVQTQVTIIGMPLPPSFCPVLPPSANSFL
jgi:hypothetical protein